VNAVSGLDLRVRAGTVHGFVGPNGAGKTTLMRMLLGLIRPTAGHGTVLGRPLGDARALLKIGSLIGRPAMYPYLSGRRNLQLIAAYIGAPSRDVERLLELVAMEGAADARFKTYSLEMKQRLGVAAALLGDPELLILDEPMNGLDPQGVNVMRDMIRAYGDAGHTVLFSSHRLQEAAHICDRVSILNVGRLVAEGTLHEVRALDVGGEPFPHAAAAEGATFERVFLALAVDTASSWEEVP
jgi:ABC-2 type transport system ATP-binding protein